MIYPRLQHRALEGVRVYDASMGVAGPCCTYLMALAGADVIKVEPAIGDWGRKIGNQYDGVGSLFLAYNRGKRSIALDLKSESGLAAARALAGHCDVVVESFRPGAMKRLGLDYATLSAERPEIVYTSISGFGQHGPYAALAAMDPMIQAFSGWLDLNRDNTGNPILMRHVPVDVVTGLYAFQAVSIGLLKRFRFGTGSLIDVNLMQAAAAFLAPRLMDVVLGNGELKESTGVPMGVFPARSGMISVAVKDDKEFALLCEALGTPQWKSDPRFVTRAARIANKEAMIAALNAKLAEQDAAEWEKRLRDNGLPASRVNTIAEFLADEHVQATKLVSSAEQPGFGPTPFVPTPGLSDGTEACSPAPKIGEHTRQILAELEYGQPLIDEMIEHGAAIAN